MGFSSISTWPFLSHYVDATWDDADVPSIPARDAEILSGRPARPAHRAPRTGGRAQTRRRGRVMRRPRVGAVWPGGCAWGGGQAAHARGRARCAGGMRLPPPPPARRQPHYRTRPGRWRPTWRRLARPPSGRAAAATCSGRCDIVRRDVFPTGRHSAKVQDTPLYGVAAWVAC
jgi:hypothetical protein